MSSKGRWCRKDCKSEWPITPETRRIMKDVSGLPRREFEVLLWCFLVDSVTTVVPHYGVVNTTLNKRYVEYSNVDHKFVSRFLSLRRVSSTITTNNYDRAKINQNRTHYMCILYIDKKLHFFGVSIIIFLNF